MNWNLRIILRRRVWSLSDCKWTRTQNQLVRKRRLNYFAKLASFAKWLIFRLRTNWFWVRIQLQSLKLLISCLVQARISLTFSQLQSVNSLWNAYATWQKHTDECEDQPKIKSLCKMLAYMITDEQRTLIKAFLVFRYCPLVSIPHSNRINNKINTVHKKFFGITGGDKNFCFQD